MFLRSNIIQKNDMVEKCLLQSDMLFEIDDCMDWPGLHSIPEEYLAEIKKLREIGKITQMGNNELDIKENKTY